MLLTINLISMFLFKAKSINIIFNVTLKVLFGNMLCTLNLISTFLFKSKFENIYI